MKKLLFAWAALAAFFIAQPAFAQWQVPDHSVPVGRGAGVQGFKAVGPCATGEVIAGNGTSADPTCQQVGGFAANPTASIGLNAVNGSASTFLRSDAAQPLSSSIQSALTGINHGIAIGTGAFGFTTTSPGSSGYALIGNGSASNPTFQAFTQTGSGAIARSWQSKIQEFRSILDFGAVGDNSTDDSAALQAAVNSCTGICEIELPPATNCYRIASSVTWKYGVILKGTHIPNPNIDYIFTSGDSALCFASTGQISLPGSSNLTANTSSAMGFINVLFNGGNLGQACIYAPELNPGRGSWGVTLFQDTFYHCQPAVYAETAWDWWIQSNSFIENGNAVSGSGAEVASLYFKNSAQSYAGANTNSIHVTNNFFDTTDGRAIQSDCSGAGAEINLFFSVIDNHFGPQGYESIYGCFGSSIFSGNESEGTTSGLRTLDLENTTGTGRNIIINNVLQSGGQYDVFDDNALDNIIGNTFIGSPSASAHIRLGSNSFVVTVNGNKSSDSSCCNTIPMVSDAGSGSSIFWNDGSDGVPSGNEVPQKINGTPYQAQLSTAAGFTSYTPSVTCQSGTITTLGSVSGKYKIIGPITYFTATINITTNGSCATALKISLPSSATDNIIPTARENAGGLTATGIIGSGTNYVYLTKYDATYPGFSGSQFTITGWYK